MAVSSWVYDKATGRFLFGGFYTPSFDSGTQAVAAFVDSHPDPVREKWDAVNSVVVPVTPAELAADAVTLADLVATRDLDQKALKAMLTALWECIPAPTMTKVQARARAIAIYKALT